MKHYKTISELFKSNGFSPPENPLLGLLTFEESEKCTFIEREIYDGVLYDCLNKIKIRDISVWQNKVRPRKWVTCFSKTTSESIDE